MEEQLKKLIRRHLNKIEETLFIAKTRIEAGNYKISGEIEKLSEILEDLETAEETLTEL